MSSSIPSSSSCYFSLGNVIESQILHTTTQRTLHAHNFSKTSSRATYILTDVLSRYLVLLSETCARYAQHAGRTGVTVRDAISALDEFGVDVEELKEYAEGEAKELARYTAQTAKRAQELAEIQTIIRDGTFHDPSGDIHLVYAPFDGDDTSNSDDDHDDGYEQEDVPIKMEEELTEKHLRHDTPDSEPDSPSVRPHKRIRLSDSNSNSNVPDYIPSFFPRFPNETGSSSSASATSESTPPLLGPPPPPPEPLPDTAQDLTTENGPSQQNGVKPTTVHLPVRQPSPALPTSTSTTSSYLTSISYENSSLAGTPEWHLPKSAPSVSLTTDSASASTIPSLLSSYSYLQSSSLSAPSGFTSNPLHHGLSMMLVGLSSRAYSPAPTLFGTSSVNTYVPRRAAFLPAYAVPLDKNGKPILNSSAISTPATLPLPPPEWHARSIAGPVPYIEPTTMQGSRIPILARGILSHSVLMKVSRLVAPPPLERNGQKLLYGPPIPAHWNSVTSTEHKALKGKEKDGEEDEVATRVLADAHLLATWDYDVKDFRQGLPMTRRGSKAVAHHHHHHHHHRSGNTSGNGPSSVSTTAAAVIPKRKRSESTFGY